MATYKYKLVMLVDDNEIDNIINSKIIEAAKDFAEDTLVFQTGAEALEYLHENQGDDGELPQIIFLDINMPVMDGFQFLEEFEKLNPAAKSQCSIIMLSSSISPRDIDKAASSQYVKKYLNKPLNNRYLNAINV